MDVEAFFANIQSQLDQELPFVVYKKAGEDTVHSMLQEDGNLHEVISYEDAGFIFAPFAPSEKVILIPVKKSAQYSCTVSDSSLLMHKVKSNSKYINTQPETNLADKKNHIALVKRGIKAIEIGFFKKVVVSRKETASYSGKEVLLILKRLIVNYPAAFVYCWYHPKIGTWLGATPEVLLKIKENEFSTMALAGTQPFVDSMDVDWGTKEIEEQAMVTNFVLKQLANVTTHILPSETYTHKAGTLLHLRTDITAILRPDVSAIKDSIHFLHPTPAVCGLPKKEATSFILENEAYDRKYYTGFLGELNLEEEGNTISNLFVNLRCMELENEKAIIYVGGGITKDSNPEKEWEETVRKTETMKKVLR